MQVPITSLFKKSYQSFGLGAFNVFNAEQIYAVTKAIDKSQHPAIIQITPTALDYLPLHIFKNCIAACSSQFPNAEFSVHLDHGNVECCHRAIESGCFDSVMIDASHLAFEENIAETRNIVSEAHKKGIAVEAELGVLGGIEDSKKISEEQALYTNPKQVQEFVDQTKCDSLAVAIGTSHGAYKFSYGNGLQLQILDEICQRIPGFPIVLHGASAVPQDEITRVNKAGGQLKSGAQGVSTDEIKEAIKRGVCKINIATDMRLIWTRIHREFFRDSPELFDMIIPGKTYMLELEDFVIKKINDLA